MRDQQGFTLIEILVSVAIFAMLVIGALGVLGAAGAGGFLEGFPSGLATARTARDITAAGVFLESFQEYVATKDDATFIEGGYCEGVGCGVDAGCTGSALSGSGITGYPTPPGETYQLAWRCLGVTVEKWYWDDTTDTDGAGSDKGKVYCVFASTGCSAVVTTEYLTRVRTRLTWRLRNVDRTIELDRFMP
jgi:prepilin-type N-terminal cleavage/methylation domain-containing protein